MEDRIKELEEKMEKVVTWADAWWILLGAIIVQILLGIFWH